MQPRKGDMYIHIPLTFDVVTKGRALSKGKGLWVVITLVAWLLSSIFAISVVPEHKFRYPVIAFFVVIIIIRFIILQEIYFRRKRKELMNNNYIFSYNLFWNIYEINDAFPYFVQFVNGLKGVFVIFDKDIVVGKEDDADFNHYEALAEAYNQLAKRDIEFMHIDYMDTVGQDSRLDLLFDNAAYIENEDLKSVIMHMYDYMGDKMRKVYSSYDVYCFYFRGREELFWEDLKIIIHYFKQANYLRARFFNKEAVGELVKAVMNLHDFSVNKTCEELFKNSMTVEYIRPIWVEKNGERKVLNKTLEEIAEVKRVSAEEKKLRKSRNRNKKRNKSSDDLDLFD